MKKSGGQYNYDTGKVETAKKLPKGGLEYDGTVKKFGAAESAGQLIRALRGKK